MLFPPNHLADNELELLTCAPMGAVARGRRPKLRFQNISGLAPSVARAAFLFNPVTATYFEYWLNPFKAAAVSFAVEAIAAPVRDRSELESVIVEQARAPNGGLVVMPDTKRPEHFVDKLSLADIHSSLERAGDVLSTVNGSQAQGPRRHRY